MQLYRYSVNQPNKFCRHNPLCCFTMSVYCCKHIFRYRLSPETFGYTLVEWNWMTEKIAFKFALLGTDSRTPWSWVLLEKLIDACLPKKSPASCGTWRFITVFTRVQHWTLSWARWIQSTSINHISLKSILVVSSYCAAQPVARGQNISRDTVVLSAETFLLNFYKRKINAWISLYFSVSL
jgi:hypothetical protein